MYRYLDCCNYCGRRYYRCNDQSDIDIVDLKNLQNQGAIIIDVRSPQEYNEGHIENSILIPEYEITENNMHIIPDKNQFMVVYCSTGSRSKRAQEKLMRIGYANVYNLYNGIQNY